MAGKSSVISVKILGDAKDLKKALDDADSGLRKFASASTTALTGVAVAVGAAATGVAVALADIGISVDGMENAIIRGTGAAGEALDDLLDSALEVMTAVPQSSGDVAAALADANTYFGLTGDELEVVTALLLDFARVADVEVGSSMRNIRGVMTQFGLDVENIDEHLGDLLRISQATGLPMAQMLSSLSQWGPTFASVGFKIEETVAIMGQLDRAGIDVARVGSGLTRFFAQAADAGDDPRVALEALVAEIEAASSQTDALSLAMDAFGQRGALMMVNAIQAGSLDLENFAGLIGEGTGLVDAQAVAVLTLGDRFSILRNKVFVALEPVATRLFKAIERGMIRLEPIVTDLTERFSAWLESEAFEEFKDTVVGALETVAEVVGDVVRAVAGWIKQNPEAFFAAVAAVIGVVLVGAVVALAAALSSVTLIVAGVVAAVVALAAGIAWVYTEFEVVRFVVDKVVDAFEILWEVVEGVFQVFERLIDGDFAGAWDAIREAAVEVGGKILDYFGSLPGDVLLAIGDGLFWLVGAGGNMALAILDGIGDIAGKIVDKIGEIPGMAWKVAGDLWDFGASLGKAVINGLISIWNRADLEFPRIEVPDWIPGIGGKGFGGFDIFPDIAYLAAGGIVTQPTLAVVGEAGPEAVVPLNRAGGMLGGPVTININLSGPVDGQDVVEAIQRETRWRGIQAFPVRTDRRR